MIYWYFNPFPVEVIKIGLVTRIYLKPHKTIPSPFPTLQTNWSLFSVFLTGFPIRWNPQIALYKEITPGMLTPMGMKLSQPK